MMDNCCLFVSSSDNTFDVFSLVSGSVVKSWMPANLAFYVGLNEQTADAPFQTVTAPVSGWRTELESQINALPHQFHYIILILDDFFFNKEIDSEELSYFLNLMNSHKIDYLRLKPIERSALGKIFQFFKNLRCDIERVNRLAYDEPYYTSLQAAIWERSYLLKMLTQNGSIWEFEHNVIDGSRHYAVKKNLLDYEHLVEKGKWFKYAPRSLGFPNQNLFEKRGFVRSWKKNSKIFNMIKFGLLGYTIFRLRRSKFLRN